MNTIQLMGREKMLQQKSNEMFPKHCEDKSSEIFCKKSDLIRNEAGEESASQLRAIIKHNKLSE